MGVSKASKQYPLGHTGALSTCLSVFQGPIVPCSSTTVRATPTSVQEVAVVFQPLLFLFAISDLYTSS